MSLVPRESCPGSRDGKETIVNFAEMKVGTKGSKVKVLRLAFGLPQGYHTQRLAGFIKTSALQMTSQGKVMGVEEFADERLKLHRRTLERRAQEQVNWVWSHHKRRRKK
jgi:hypothetical protein